MTNMYRKLSVGGSKKHPAWRIGSIMACVATFCLLLLVLPTSNSSRYSAYTATPTPLRSKLLLTDMHASSQTLSHSASTLQLLTAELSKLPGADLIQKHIMPLVDTSKLSAADLPMLLQATNFPNLTTAQLLDTSGGLSSQDRWQLMNLHQQMYCRSGLTKDQRHLANAVAVPQGNFSIYVYKDNDIVSRFLAGEKHAYEENDVAEVMWALEQFKPKPQQQQQQLGSVTGPDKPLMVDVGANVGTFLFKVAAAGYRVAAFEGMPSNVALLRHSLCANPNLSSRVALYGTGLGPQSSTCWVISDNGNVGDGHTVCDEAEVKQRTTNTGYSVRGEMSVRRLDTILAEDVQVMKMDVEGFEQQVLLGAEGLLKKYNVHYIVAECTFGGEPKQREFLKYMDGLGYQISLSSFKGPFLDSAAIKDGSSAVPYNNIFCVKSNTANKPS